MMMTTLMKITVRVKFLQNDAALDVFLTNELASLLPSVLRDYYELVKYRILFYGESVC